MKFLFLSHEYPPVGGGGANACMYLAKSLADRGHTVHVLTVQYGDHPAEHTEKDGRLIVFRIPAKRSSVSQSSFSEMLDYVRKAGSYADRLCEKEKYDYCLCFYGIPSGLLALQLKNRHGLRYVIRLGGGDVPGFQNRFDIIYKVVSSKLKQIWRNADRLVANSRGLRVFALEFCSDYRIDVICNGVDTDIFRPAGDEKRDDSIELLTVCRLIERKGLQDIVPYMADIQEKTHRRVHWVIVGDGPYREELEKLASEHGSSDLISFEGHRQRGQLPEYYSRADIFAFPSHREGMPNTVLEAMASGLPVIMRKDCQGAEELVRDNGIASEEDIIADIETMICMDPGQLKAMGDRSRGIAENEFSWAQIAEKYEELFTELA